MVLTNRVRWQSTAYPIVEFNLEGDVLVTRGPGGTWNGVTYTYGCSIINLYLTCYHRGGSNEYYNDGGDHVAWGNGIDRGRHSADPFLPSGYTNGQLRWQDGPMEIVLPANSSGYWSGTSTSYPITMQAYYPPNNSGFIGGTIPVARIAQYPGAPTPLSTTPDQITNTSIRYQFNAGSDGGSAFVRHEYQYSTTSNFSSGNSAVITSSGTSTATGLTPKKTYYFRSRSVNGVGAGPWSAVKSATTIDVPGQPTLTYQSKSSTNIQVLLNDPSYTGGTITAREVQISTSSSFSSILQTKTTATANFTGLTRGTTYYIRARVKNSIGWSIYTATLTQATDLQVPSTPTGYSAHDIATTTAWSTMGSITDNGGSGLDQLNYQINTSASATGATDVTLDSAREPMFTGLTAGTTYYYRQRVYNGQFWSAFGAWVSFVADTNVPGPPTSPAATAIDDTNVTFTWAAPSNLYGSTVTGYRVWIAKNKEMTSGSLTKDVVGATSQVFTDLSPLTTYYCLIRASSTNGNGSYTTQFSFTTTAVNGTDKPFWLNVNGVWKNVTVWQRVGTVWEQITSWINVSGVWKG